MVKLINHSTINIILPKYYYLNIYNFIFIQKIFVINKENNNHYEFSHEGTETLNRFHTISFKSLNNPIIIETKEYVN